jgi:hypothetical protein
MTEFEKAIKYWEKFKQESVEMIAKGKDRNDILAKQVPMCDIALAALRVKGEREKGCKFCCYAEYPGEKLYPKEGYTFYAGFYKQINDDAFAEGELEKLKFCPSCGKRLEVEP